MPDPRQVQLPAEYKLPPCPRCRFYDPGITSSLCRFIPAEPQPIFYASLKHGPAFECFSPK